MKISDVFYLVFYICPIGSLPLSVQALPPHVQDIHQRVMTFVQERIIPLESEFEAWCADPKTKWTINPKIEELKVAIVMFCAMYHLKGPHQLD